MSLPEIRPLSFGETLDRSFALYRSHFLVLATICLIPGLAVLLMDLPLEFLSGATAEAHRTFNFPAMIYTIVSVVIYMFIEFLTMAACVFTISEIYLGREVTVESAYRKMRQRVGPM